MNLKYTHTATYMAYGKIVKRQKDGTIKCQIKFAFINIIWYNNIERCFQPQQVKIRCMEGVPMNEELENERARFEIFNGEYVKALYNGELISGYFRIKGDIVQINGQEIPVEMLKNACFYNSEEHANRATFGPLN